MKTLLITSFILFLTVRCVAQATISPSFAFGSYQHFEGEKNRPVAMVNVSAGYMFTVQTPNKEFYPVTELNVLVPLLNNSLPFSFSLHGGLYLPVFDKVSFLIAAGPELHIKELYAYPLNKKDATHYPEHAMLQWSGKARIIKQYQDDDVLKLFTEFAYDQRMPLIKFGMFITIKSN